MLWKSIRLKIEVCWRDLWILCYIGKKEASYWPGKEGYSNLVWIRKIYFCIIPCFPLVLSYCWLRSFKETHWKKVEIPVDPAWRDTMPKFHDPHNLYKR